MSIELKTEQSVTPVEAVVAPVETAPLNTETSKIQESQTADLPDKVESTPEASTIHIAEEFLQAPSAVEDSNDTSGDKLRKIFQAKEQIRQSGEEIPVL